MAFPCILKLLDAIRRKNQVQIERAVFQLHKILSTADFLTLPLRQLETEIVKGLYNPLAVAQALFHEQIGVLRGIGVAK